MLYQSRTVVVIQLNVCMYNLVSSAYMEDMSVWCLYDFEEIESEDQYISQRKFITDGNCQTEKAQTFKFEVFLETVTLVRRLLTREH